ncbi:hypothetical protein RCH18_001914 [Flavobacterium sp. PL11]|uniref:addiction module component CHP02574 family protein n=1 Tax=Flavobacterium sp. PL11 TaxID=3071717 RepID=UPI002DFA2A51|nr:hypothetical protein [Flavobacterium sp. PL11]
MNVQYIFDNLGNKTAVVIAIEDWESIKKSCPSIEKVNEDLPQWQKDIVLERLHNPQGTMDAFEMIDDLENEKI